MSVMIEPEAFETPTDTSTASDAHRANKKEFIEPWVSCVLIFHFLSCLCYLFSLACLPASFLHDTCRTVTVAL